ncbi:MAG: hypothetical protein ABIX46_14105 [Burkholderiaceae bacterium]
MTPSIPAPAATSVRPGALPPGALLGRYRDDGAYTDCYVTDLQHAVSQADYVEAFYGTALFKLERWLLAQVLALPSTDAQARELAAGTRSGFAAWKVEARTPDQLLLCDVRGRTRSWLMSAPVASGLGAGGSTRLYFGSAVVPAATGRGGRPRMGGAFRALLGLHRLYARSLLRAAAARLARSA